MEKNRPNIKAGIREVGGAGAKAKRMPAEYQGGNPGGWRSRRESEKDAKKIPKTIKESIILTYDWREIHCGRIRIPTSPYTENDKGINYPYL
ncbi:hypothetical protein QE152_g5036 [Popillia japonica]|uniref:Uncharacterized protein n=1 Tax=Popillia japonica TaxID=7064 RepID=A0AAW1MQM6_POPJA